MSASGVAGGSKISPTGLILGLALTDSVPLSKHALHLLVSMRVKGTVERVAHIEAKELIVVGAELIEDANL